MTLAELRKKRAELAKQLRDIHDKASGENRDLNETESADWARIKGEVASLDTRIEREKELADDEQRHAALAPRAGAGGESPAISGVRDLEADKPFATFGEYLRAVIASSTPGCVIDKRLNALRAASGANEGVGSQGGFLVQTDQATEILSKAYAVSNLASRCRRIQIGSNSNSISIKGVDESSRVTGSRWGGVQVYWAGEADTVTASKPKFRDMELKLGKLMGLYYATDELMQDASALGGIVGQAFTEEIAWMLDSAIIGGTGAGQPLGFMNSAALVTQNKEGSQAADTILSNNISKMWSRLHPRSKGNAVWLCNPDVTPQFDTLNVAVKNVAGTENVGGVTQIVYDAARNTIKGRPIVEIEQCETIGDLGDFLLVDLSQYLIIEKGGLQAAESMHVKFIYGENTLRFTYRVNGQPLWDKVLTPAKGSNTLSPFVALQAR